MLHPAKKKSGRTSRSSPSQEKNSGRTSRSSPSHQKKIWSDSLWPLGFQSEFTMKTLKSHGFPTCTSMIFEPAEKKFWSDFTVLQNGRTSWTSGGRQQKKKIWTNFRVLPPAKKKNLVELQCPPPANKKKSGRTSLSPAQSGRTSETSPRQNKKNL